nr:hypothetical protein Iba_scaffold9471CG0030 [Ipomoea batatas]
MVIGTSEQHSFVANTPLESGFIDSSVSCDGQAADDLDYMSSGYNILANSDQEVSSHAEPSAQNAFPSPTQSVSSMQLDPHTNLEQSPEQNDVGSQLNCLPSQQ